MDSKIPGLASNETEVGPVKSSYILAREKRMADLSDIAEKLESKQRELDKTAGVSESIPNNLIHDPLINPIIQYRTMVEVNEIYENTRNALGRKLTEEEEEKLLVTLDYVFKRVINFQIKKDTPRSNYSKKDYFNLVRLGVSVVLPGDRNITSSHDLVHVVLAIKQGLLNDNSAIPSFMRIDRGFNSGQQAMLEEAFASMFSASEDIIKKEISYDLLIKMPFHFHEMAKIIFHKNKSTLYRGLFFGDSPIFTDIVIGDEAHVAIRSFLENNQGNLEKLDQLTSLALFSQGASLSENFNSLSDEDAMSQEDRLVFIKEQIKIAQENIDAIITGVVLDDKDDKYKETVSITRAFFEKALRSIKDNPDKPIFVEELLGTLVPLYAKAKAQQDATFDRLASLKFDLK